MEPLPPSNVLVIDDDPDALESMVKILGGAGYVVSTATGGHEALTMLSRFPRPDLILLDIMMPDVDGVAFRWEQLAHPSIGEVPVILVSASDDCVRLAGQLRVQGTIAKPFRAEDLLREVERVLAAV
jgi:two-component system chemotaxis response regulator CheY